MFARSARQFAKQRSGRQSDVFRGISSAVTVDPGQYGGFIRARSKIDRRGNPMIHCGEEAKYELRLSSQPIRWAMRSDDRGPTFEPRVARLRTRAGHWRVSNGLSVGNGRTDDCPQGDHQPDAVQKQEGA